MVIGKAIQTTLLAALFLAVCPVQPEAAAYPKPKAIPDRPELTFEPGALRIIQSPGNGQWYWYMTYEVSNYTGEDRIWAPTFTLFTDRGEVIESGRGVKRTQVNEIVEYLGDDMLEVQHEIIGDLYQGEGNARSGLVVWPAQRTDVNELVLFVSGISGESTVVKHPVSGEETILQKTLMREYLISGNATGLGDDPIELHSDMDRSPRWIYR